jgi:hypothetical protein
MFIAYAMRLLAGVGMLQPPLPGLKFRKVPAVIVVLFVRVSTARHGISKGMYCIGSVASSSCAVAGREGAAMPQARRVRAKQK